MDIGTGYAALTSAFEIAKGLKNIDDRVKLNAAVIDLQEKILSAQQASMDAASRMRELEQQISQFDAWERSAERYALKDYGCQTFAYEARPASLAGDPPHIACPNCFRDRRISILQYDDSYYGRKQFKCLACNKVIILGCTSPDDGETPEMDDPLARWR